VADVIGTSTLFGLGRRALRHACALFWSLAHCCHHATGVHSCCPCTSSADRLVTYFHSRASQVAYNIASRSILSRVTVSTQLPSRGWILLSRNPRWCNVTRLLDLRLFSTPPSIRAGDSRVSNNILYPVVEWRSYPSSVIPRIGSIMNTIMLLFLIPLKAPPYLRKKARILDQQSLATPRRGPCGV
jgi:hypothetical protein